MRKRITDEIFSSAVSEIYGETDMSKVAFNMSGAAATLLGYATGQGVGKAIGKQKGLTQSLRNQEIPSLEGDYYSQIENILKNLNVLFTPMSVIYTVRDKGKSVTLETIGTDEMTSKMKNAFESKNSDFFKNLFVNKIHLEVQRVEQVYALRMLDGRDKLTKTLGEKTASEDATIYENLKNFMGLQTVVSISPEGTLRDYLVKVASTEESMEIPTVLERPFREYDDLGDEVIEIYKLAATKKTTDQALQDKLLDARYVSKHVRIGFVADRVTFSVDNMVIAQLPIMGMNDEGYRAFKAKDTKYFRKVFLGEVKKEDIVKTASDALELQDIFYVSEVHPKIYYLVLNNRLGNEWIDYDPEVLVKVIETEFGLTKAISNRPLDKILSIQNICKSTDCLNNAFIFEKTARALNHKSITFLEWEFNLTPGELVNALQIIDELTPTNDIFDDLTEEVTEYIVKQFVLGDCRLLIPHKRIISSELEEKFFGIVNGDINQAWYSLNIEEAKYQRMIQALASSVIHGVRTLKKYDSVIIDDLLGRLVAKANISDERIINLARQATIMNLSIDMMIEQVEASLVKTREDINI